MSNFDLQAEVTQRVQNAVNRLKKELETAGVDVSTVHMRTTPKGILVVVESRKMEAVPDSEQPRFPELPTDATTEESE